MTDRAIVSGVLFRAPATKSSKTGKRTSSSPSPSCEISSIALSLKTKHFHQREASPEPDRIVAADRGRGRIRLRTLLTGRRGVAPQLEDHGRRVRGFRLTCLRLRLSRQDRALRGASHGA
jgi:hypothetical protein